jgi:glycosyltransferase involved in cell wall biosynthesis
MKLTIGMPSYNNFTEVFFTIQSLRMHHDLTNCEILVVDNFGDVELEKFIKAQGNGVVRYEKFTESIGTACAKNKVFELAKGEMVLCIDSHVLLAKGALENIPVTDNLIHGPLMYCDIKNYTCEWLPVWRGQMWGIWGNYSDKLPTAPFEIWGNGTGLMLAKKDTWLGYNNKFRGFGGEEGYIQEKYRKAGRKVLCYPSLVWMHMFDRKIPYPLKLIDRVINYIIGFKEIGLDLKPIQDNFGEIFSQALTEADKR